MIAHDMSPDRSSCCCRTRARVELMSAFATPSSSRLAFRPRVLLDSMWSTGRQHTLRTLMGENIRPVPSSVEV